MLRILSIATLFPSPVRPGFGPFVASQMRAVAKTGAADVVIINPIGVPPWPLCLREPYRTYATCPAQSALDTIPVHHPRFTLLPVIGGDSNPGRIVRAIWPLVQRLHAQQPFDLVDAQFFFPDGPAAATIARRLGLPLTIKARGSDIHFWSTRPRALAQIRSAANSARTLLPCSAALGRDMVALGLPADRITAHYTGLDRARFHITPRAQAREALHSRLGLAIPPDAPLIACPGALIPLKGQALALQALTQIPNAHLALAGTGPEEAALRAQIAASGLGSRVHMLGQISHDALPLLLSAAHAMVLPSEREGLANVWVESLACGTPIVITDVGGAREIVTSPSAGRIVDRTPPAIAEGLAQVLHAAIPQQEAAAHVAHLSWAQTAERLIAHWHSATTR